jgi:hypothetical protein
MLWAESVEPALGARRAFLERARDMLGWEIPGGGPSILLGCVGIGELEALDILERAGVRASPGGAFGALTPAVRLSFSGVGIAGAEQAVDYLAASHQNFQSGPAPLRDSAAGL